MKQTISCVLSLALLAVLPLLVGCGGGPSLGKVTGTVTLKGKPLPNAKVIFHPEAKGTSPSSATTDENGHYDLMYPPDRHGALIGKHKITVSTYRMESSGDGAHKVTAEAVPAEYTSTATTTLVREVKAGSQTIDLEL